jgi:hypothetical protein
MSIWLGFTFIVDLELMELQVLEGESIWQGNACKSDDYMDIKCLSWI